MQYLQEASGWIKFLGVMSIITGVVSFFSQFPFGLIVGILEIISGVFLVTAGTGLDQRDEVKAGDNLRKFFILSGILTAIVLGLTLLALVGIGLIAAS